MSQPFFGSLAVRLKLIETDAIETMATDGKALLFNPKFVDGLTLPKLIGVVAHEVMHVACLHHTRRGKRDAKKWNIAGDYAINGMLDKAGFDLPDSAPRSAAYDDKSSEAIYGLLPPDPPGKPKGGKGGNQGGGNQQGQPQPGQPEPGDDDSGPSDPGGCGEVLDVPGEDGGPASPDEIAQAENDALVATVQAMNVAKAAGKLPAGFEQIVDDLKKAKINWRDELRRFVQRISKDDYNWSHPNRRLIARGLYLPSLHSEKLGPIVIAVDTSGSTSGWWKEFAEELTGIIEDVQPEAVHVIYCDAKVQKVEVYTPENPMISTDYKFKGGGGTSFQPTFDYVEENQIEPECLIYLTDLEGSAPTQPSYPVLWACTSDEKAPFGDYIQVTR